MAPKSIFLNWQPFKVAFLTKQGDWQATCMSFIFYNSRCFTSTRFFLFGGFLKSKRGMFFLSEGKCFAVLFTELLLGCFLPWLKCEVIAQIIELKKLLVTWNFKQWYKMFWESHNCVKTPITRLIYVIEINFETTVVINLWLCKIEDETNLQDAALLLLWIGGSST